jgi:hypothetical protein
MRLQIVSSIVDSLGDAPAFAWRKPPKAREMARDHPTRAEVGMPHRQSPRN